MTASATTNPAYSVLCLPGWNAYAGRHLEVAIQGTECSFCEQAAKGFERYLRADFHILHRHNVAGVLESVGSGEAGLGIFAVQNSNSGYCPFSVDAALACCIPMQRVGEITIPVDQCLICHPQAKDKDIRRVIGHPQAIAQCQQTLVRLYPHLSLEPGTDEQDDTAATARRISESPSLRDTATLASETAAKRFGLRIIRAGMQHGPDNKTSFIIIKKRQPANPEPMRRPYQEEM